jgi:hypothetical protein
MTYTGTLICYYAKYDNVFKIQAVLKSTLPRTHDIQSIGVCVKGLHAVER